MPQTNGHSNGHNGATYDMEDGQSFLFTSESVGEGHPGECLVNIITCCRLATNPSVLNRCKSTLANHCKTP